MSMTSFFSLCSSFWRSRSSSRCAFARARWCCLRRSAGVTERPKRVSWEESVLTRICYAGCTIMFMVVEINLLLTLMDLEQIGDHCGLAACRDLDFLPIQCPSCTIIYCRFHISPDAHTCPVDPAPHHVAPIDLPHIERCSINICGTLSIAA